MRKVNWDNVQEAQDFAFLDREGDPLHRLEVAEVLLQVLYF